MRFAVCQENYPYARSDPRRSTHSAPVPGHRALLIVPPGWPLLEKRVDPFRGVARHHVLGHHPAGVGVGALQIHLDLVVKRLLAGRDDKARLAADLRGQIVDLEQGILVGFSRALLIAAAASTLVALLAAAIGSARLLRPMRSSGQLHDASPTATTA